jgi:hypothetical protein
MINSVDEYMTLLKKELEGSDAALIQDALSDAEEYLRTALVQTGDGPKISEADVMPSIIEKFGSPQEVATGYKQMETRAPAGLVRVSAQPQRPALVRFFGVFGDPRAWGSLLYMLLSLATGIVYFTWVITGLSVSAGLIILIVGLPLLTLFLLSVRAIAFVEGRLAEALLGVRMPRRPMFFNRSGGLWQKIKSLFAERITWTAMAYDILQLPLGIFYFTVAVTLLALAFYGIALPVTQLAFNMPAYVIIGDTRYQAVAWAIPFFVVGGALLLTVTMHLVRLLGRAQGSWVKMMLVSNNS